MANDKETRDRVRALVREVLASVPIGEDSSPENRTTNEKPATAEPAASASSLVDVRPPAPPETQAAEPDVTRDESGKTIITEADVRDLEPRARLRIADGARLTPLAADIIRERDIELVRRAPRRAPSSAAKTIAIGADHGGYKMKIELQRFLTDDSYKVRDFGTHSTDAVDYPDIAHAVARAVSEHEADLGIIIDGAGVGSAMTANKVPGVRAAACYSIAVAKNSREHNDANILTLGSGTITNDEMREIVKAWLTTNITEDRHRKRVAKIEAIERQYRS